jgi:predicted DNA-binding ribbon-helix-helix protein
MKTRVRGIRAKPEFWQKCDKVAKIKGTNANSLIVTIINKHCDKVLTSKKTCDKL